MAVYYNSCHLKVITETLILDSILYFNLYLTNMRTILSHIRIYLCGTR